MAILFNFYRILLGTAVGFAFKPCILDTFGTIVRVDGKSMQPTLNPDTNNVDFIFLNRWAIRNYDINRGDIITFVSPNAPERHIIKRVVGLAGDVISTIGYKTEVVKVLYIFNSYFFFFSLCFYCKYLPQLLFIY